MSPPRVPSSPRPEIYGAHRPVVSPRFDPYRVTIDIYRDIRPSDLPGQLALALAMARVFTPALSDFSTGLVGALDEHAAEVSGSRPPALNLKERGQAQQYPNPLPTAPPW